MSSGVEKGEAHALPRKGVLGRLEAFRRGDRDAVECVYREHFSAVERMVKRSLARSRRFAVTDASDVVQEVFAKAFLDGARTRYDGERPYGGFLHAVARSVVVDWIRRAAREIPSDLDTEDAHDATKIDAEPVSERACMVRMYLHDLDPELRAVYQLRFVAGEGQLTAARSLGISRQRLRTLESKLVKKLRRRFHDSLR